MGSTKLAKLGAGIATLLLGALVFLAWRFSPTDSAGPCVVTGGPLMFPELPEASGLAIGRRDPALLWSHNDSGNAAVLFALDTAGAVRGRVRVPIRARDWEDVSAARCPSGPCLYLADIGDNGRVRQRIYIYRVPEPEPAQGETAPPDVFSATYADGPHNAEAMFVLGDDLFIVTRDRVGAIYHATVNETRALTFQHIGRLGLAAVTDAEASPDGRSVVVRTSHEAVIYRAEDLTRGGDTPYLRIPIDGLREAQGEGVALDGRMLYLASEGRPWNRAGQLLSMRCDLPE